MSLITAKRPRRWLRGDCPSIKSACVRHRRALIAASHIRERNPTPDGVFQEKKSCWLVVVTSLRKLGCKTTNNTEQNSNIGWKIKPIFPVTFKQGAFPSGNLSALLKVDSKVSKSQTSAMFVLYSAVMFKSTFLAHRLAMFVWIHVLRLLHN